MLCSLLTPCPSPSLVAHKYLVSARDVALFSILVAQKLNHALLRLDPFFWIFACQNLSFIMSFKASGTLRSTLTLCLALSATILPVLSAPAPAINSSPWIPRSLKSLFETRATENKCGGASGLYITNSGSGSQTFTVYQGKWSITSDPYTTKTLASGGSAVVTLPSGFVGHVQRGTLLPATWVELNMVAGAAWADVSLEIGCDGAATVQADALDAPMFGFSATDFPDFFKNAPSDAFYNPASGANYGGTMTTATNVLDATGDNTVINQHTLTYEQGVLKQSNAYLIGGSGTNGAVASDNCLLITFY